MPTTAQRSMGTGGSRTGATGASDGGYYSTQGWNNLNPAFAAQLRRLAAAVAARGGRIWWVSGWRSTQRQAQLYADAVRQYGQANAGHHVAAPGHSHHETGDAMDLGGDLNLAHELASEFGLHFPMSWEPWHIESSDTPSSSQAQTTAPDMRTQQPPEVDRTDPVTHAKVLESMLTGSFAIPSIEEVSFAPEQTDPNANADPNADPNSPNTGQDIDRFLRAVAGIETSSDPGMGYARTNSDSGAHGRYQIMPDNWAPWSREAGLGPGASQSPQNQELVARFKLGQYRQQFGSWEAAAVAWYAGPSAAQRYMRNPADPFFARRQRGGYPSINDYVRGVMSRMGGRS